MQKIQVYPGLTVRGKKKLKMQRVDFALVNEQDILF